MEVVIFIGIQATGKSTFYKQYFFKSHMYINLDMLRTRRREDIFIDACIKANQSFVIDNTNPTIENRKKYIDIAKKSDSNVVGYYFESNVNESIKRNENRLGKRFIPAVGIKGTYNKLVLPTFDEGFEKLYYVRIEEDNSFAVSEYEKYISK